MPARFALLFLACSTASLAAQSVVVPNANANVRGTTQLNSLVRNAGNPRTYMLGINAAELAGIPAGSIINGVSFRFQVFASNPAAWPPADITWTDYQIFVGPAIPTTGWTGSFMTNFSSTPVQARSGPMLLPANTYTNTSPPTPNPNAWGEFYFDFQVPYLYTGGDLGLLFSHPGSNDTSTARYLGCVASSSSTFGVGYYQATYPVGTGGTSSTFCIPRIHYGYGTGCPGTGGMVPNLVQSQNTLGGLGGTILMAIANAPANAPSFYAFGFGRQTVPITASCNLYTVPVITQFLLLDPNGRGSLALLVPPGLTATVNAQALVLDPGALSGFTLTNAIEPQAF